jgi:hypothetical protein
MTTIFFHPSLLLLVLVTGWVKNKNYDQLIILELLEGDFTMTKKFKKKNYILQYTFSRH